VLPTHLPEGLPDAFSRQRPPDSAGASPGLRGGGEGDDRLRRLPAFRVSRRWYCRWLPRWRAGGRRGLVDRSSRPGGHRSLLGRAQEEQIVLLRRLHGWGPDRIAALTSVPRSTVHRVIRRRGLQVVRPPRESVVRYQFSEPGGLLQRARLPEHCGGVLVAACAAASGSTFGMCGGCDSVAGSSRWTIEKTRAVEPLERALGPGPGPLDARPRPGHRAPEEEQGVSGWPGGAHRGRGR
jgi:Homeodomain-like domain